MRTYLMYVCTYTHILMRVCTGNIEGLRGFIFSDSVINRMPLTEVLEWLTMRTDFAQYKKKILKEIPQLNISSSDRKSRADESYASSSGQSYKKRLSMVLLPGRR